MKLIYLKSAWKSHSFDDSTEIPIFIVLFTIEPGRSLLPFVTTNCLIDYEQAFNSVDRRALTKVLSLYLVPDKHITVISDMYKNKTTAVKVGNGVGKWFCNKSGFT